MVVIKNGRKKYIQMLKKILDENDFNTLKHEVCIMVNKKFRNVNKEQVEALINLNLAAIVVYSIEKVKGCKKRDFNTRFYNYNIGARIFLVERATGNFEKKFNYYIKIVTKYIRKNGIMQSNM